MSIWQKVCALAVTAVAVGVVVAALTVWVGAVVRLGVFFCGGLQ